MSRTCALILTCIAGLCSSAAATAVDVQPSRDNTIYQSTDPLSQNSNAKGENLFAGTTASPAIRRALLAFDLSAIPAGSIINSVTLKLHADKSGSTDTTLALHRLTTNWGEGTSLAGPTRDGGGVAATSNDATWLYSFYNGTSWTTPGGDFISSPSSTLAVPASGLLPSFYLLPSTPQLIADVQSWVNTPAGNFGWALRGSEANGGSALRVASRENLDPSFRPVLSVDFTTVPEPASALLLVAIAATVATNRTRRTPRRIS